MNLITLGATATVALLVALPGGMANNETGPDAVPPSNDAPCAGDISGDGLVDQVDLMAVLSAWGEESSPADVTHDGVVDETDLVTVVGSWGPCAAPAQGGYGCGIEDGAFVTADGGCKDLVTGLAWSNRLGQNSAYDAEDIVDALTQGGYDDWRLPSVNELLAWRVNGGPGHMDPPYVGGVYSNERNGNWVQAVTLSSGDVRRIWAYSIYYYYAVREGSGDPPGCNGNGICDPGEDCESCSDCPGRTSGKPSERYCCGNGILEPGEDVICPDNP